MMMMMMMMMMMRRKRIVSALILQVEMIERRRIDKIESSIAYLVVNLRSLAKNLLKEERSNKLLQEQSLLLLGMKQGSSYQSLREMSSLRSVDKAKIEEEEQQDLKKMKSIRVRAEAAEAYSMWKNGNLESVPNTDRTSKTNRVQPL